MSSTEKIDVEQHLVALSILSCTDAKPSGEIIRLLLAEVRASRAMNDHQYTDDPDSPASERGGQLVDAYNAAGAATDAALTIHPAGESK